MNSITIRLVIQEDDLKMVPLMKEYIVDFYQRKQSVEKIKQHFTYLLAHQSQGVQYVAEHRGELIGFATLYFSFSTLSLQKNAILNDLYVSPSYRGKKVGERLFQACFTYVKEHEYASMTWETAKDNIVAQKLYAKMGGIESQWKYYELNI